MLGEVQHEFFNICLIILCVSNLGISSCVCVCVFLGMLTLAFSFRVFVHVGTSLPPSCPPSQLDSSKNTRASLFLDAVACGWLLLPLGAVAGDRDDDACARYWAIATPTTLHLFSDAAADAPAFVLTLSDVRCALVHAQLDWTGQRDEFNLLATNQ